MTKNKTALWTMLIFRAIFFLLIIYSTVMYGFSAALFYWILFVGTLFLPLLGKKDPEYYYIDAFAMVVFISSIVVGETRGFDHGIWDIDKFMHIAGGACLAWFAAIFYRQHIKKRWVLFLTILLFVLAMGAAWELFEWVFYIGFSAGFSPYYLTDTMLDLLSDLSGGLVLLLILIARRYV